ncbi:odorant-binding protein-like [Camelus dromedarius]|uniref:odorant-binding protein-like n=1 Tax=Camelus dromedarius TaxID=9838 RepID=UPI0031191D81
MRILFLLLVLGMLCAAQELPTEEAQSDVVSEWRTIYIAASNTEKISENGPFQVFNRDIEIDDENRRIAFKFFIKHVCAHVYSHSLTHAGTNEFKVIQASENTVIASDVNVDEEGTQTTLTGVFATGKDTEEEDFKKFKHVTKEKGIPEENTVKIISLDDCPDW